jgi:hypothetical protein
MFAIPTNVCARAKRGASLHDYRNDLEVGELELLFFGPLEQAFQALHFAARARHLHAKRFDFVLGHLLLLRGGRGRGIRFYG